MLPESQLLELQADIRQGDIGRIRGARGLFCVASGAKCLDNVTPCGKRATENAIESDALTMSDGTICWRRDFLPSTRDTVRMDW